MPNADVVLGLHVLATIMMTTIIWFVQLVHYPLFQHVGASEFTSYERAHTQRISPIVGPLMLLEAATAVLLIALGPAWATRAELWLGLVLLGVIWLSTATLQVPAHRRLTEGYEPGVIRRLVATNWIRTGAWSARAALALLWIAR